MDSIRIPKLQETLRRIKIKNLEYKLVKCLRFGETINKENNESKKINERNF